MHLTNFFRAYLRNNNLNIKATKNSYHAFDFLFIVDNVKEKVVKKRKQLFRYNFEGKSYFSWKEVRSLRVYFIHSSVYLANNFL